MNGMMDIPTPYYTTLDSVAQRGISTGILRHNGTFASFSCLVQRLIILDLITAGSVSLGRHRTVGK